MAPHCLIEHSNEAEKKGKKIYIWLNMNPNNNKACLVGHFHASVRLLRCFSLKRTC